MHREIGGYRPQNLEGVAAFDVDVGKVGKDVAGAIFEPPNWTTRVMRGSSHDWCRGAKRAASSPAWPTT
jgi:myo-inositol-1-phosphate synthase